MKDQQSKQIYEDILTLIGKVRKDYSDDERGKVIIKKLQEAANEANMLVLSEIIES